MAGFGSLKVVDGRCICGGEDWGKAYDNGEPLPCCGCKLGSAASLRNNPCGCRCHETPRAWARSAS